LCLSHGYKEQLQSCREGRRKITAVAPNALLELPSPQNKPRQIPNNPPVIGFVGRMEPVKGVDLLLEAAAIMKARSIDFRMVIAGGDPGRYRQQATALQLDSHVTFPGWCDNPTKLYNTWDIFCLPSREEPFGLSLIEAMACGLPVVTTECNGPRDIVGTDGSGLIVPKNDVTALAVALTSLVLDSELRQKMGDNARSRVIAHFSHQAVGHRLIQALKELRSK
jgi:glycosyltransferase involved in cell wall biosynthesis